MANATPGKSAKPTAQSEGENDNSADRSADRGAEPKPKSAPQRRMRGTLLRDLDMSPTLERAAYETRVAALQHELQRIQQAYLHTGDKAVIVLEGWDAAGKGGTIRVMASALDPRSLKVWPIGAPRSYFKERHYLARFWEKLPPSSGLAVFDRSWYGRVLVERVEGFATEPEWRRAYAEINEFERLLADDGVRLVKAFLHITPEEQLARFEKRLTDPLKRWKLSYEDFRNRARWEEYEVAIEEMLARTSTDHAPWKLIPANNKKFARVTVLETIVERLAAGIDLRPAPIDARIVDAAKAMFDLDEDQWEIIAQAAE